MSNPRLALEFENVTKTFSSDPNAKKVVDNLSFSVKEGEFFSILGPSGCGKTTCLRMISGLENPTSGVVRMFGKVVNGVHPHERNVHMVFQKYALFPHLNVYDNVAFGLRMKKLSESQVKDRVTRMLKMVRLDDYAKRPIQQLSGGEQQRVALTRALVNEPSILLLDEPLGALDLKLREQMQTELANIQKQLGITFIFVTHDQWEALTLSDGIAIMNGGKIEQIGSPTEVYEQPHTAFVSKFVGTTNLFRGTITQINGNVAYVQTSESGTLYSKIDNLRFEPKIGLNVGLVVRPEKIRVRVSAPSTTSSSANPQAGMLFETQPTENNQPTHHVNHSINVMRGNIIERTYFGATTQIKIKVPEISTPLISVIANQTATKMPQLKMGEKYYAVWDSSDSVLVLDQ